MVFGGWLLLSKSCGGCCVWEDIFGGSEYVKVVVYMDWMSWMSDGMGIVLRVFYCGLEVLGKCGGRCFVCEGEGWVDSSYVLMSFFSSIVVL